MGQRTENIFKRGEAFLHDNDLEQALRLFNQVLNREPTHRPALRNKCLIKVMKNADDAEEVLLFAIKQHPEDDQLHQMLGSFYQKNKEPEKAMEAFEKAVSIDENNALAHFGIAMINAQSLEDHEQAIKHYLTAEKAGMDSADLYFNRGCSYMILGESQKAKSDFEKAKNFGHEEAEKFLKSYFE